MCARRESHNNVILTVLGLPRRAYPDRAPAATGSTSMSDLFDQHLRVRFASSTGSRSSSSSSSRSRSCSPCRDTCQDREPNARYAPWVGVAHEFLYSCRGHRSNLSDMMQAVYSRCPEAKAGVKADGGAMVWASKNGIQVTKAGATHVAMLPLLPVFPTGESVRREPPRWLDSPV